MVSILLTISFFVACNGMVNMMDITWAKGDGVDEADRGMVDVGDGVDEADRGMVDVGDGVDEADRGMVDVGDGVDEADRGMVDVGDGVDEADRGIVDVGDGVDEADRGMVDVLIRHERSSNSRLVDIARFIDTSHAGQNYPVFVDETMKRLIFQVTTEGASPAINVTNSAGQPFPIQPMLNTNDTKVTATLDIPLNHTDYGIWTFKRNDDSTWDVAVQGESPVYITYELYEVGSNTSLDDSPIASDRYGLLIVISGMSDVQSVTNVYMFSKSRFKLKKLITFNATYNDSLEAENTTILFEPFYVGIVGTDNSNRTFRRIDPRDVAPVRVALNVPSYKGVKLFEDSRLNINFTVTAYHMSARHIEVNVQDSGNFVLEPKAMNFTLLPGKHDTGVFVLKAGTAGTSTTVTISAKFSSGRGALSDGPQVVRIFTVLNEDSGTPVGAIVGGLLGAIAVVAGTVGSFIVYRKCVHSNLKVKQDINKEDEHVMKTPVET